MIDVLNVEWPNSDRDLHISTPVMVYLEKKYNLKIRTVSIFNAYYYILLCRPKVLFISNFLGADIIKRPYELANDTATTFDAIKHTIDNLENYDYIVLLQPTSPLRNEKHIDEAIELLEEKQADAIVSVCEMDHSPFWSNTLPKDGNMNNFLRDEVLNKRSQDLEKYYRVNGAVYICKTDKLLENKSFFLKDNIFAYIMDRKSSIDIDEEIDFEIAKVLINK